MDYDDIVIGSGLAALGTVLGLPVSRRILVIGGPRAGSTYHYGHGRVVPCAHLGYGGLGNYWHGVIPTGLRNKFGSWSEADFENLFHYFYPGEDIAKQLGKASLFIPWKPIRPAREWSKLVSDRPSGLTLVHDCADRFDVEKDGVTVHTATRRHRAHRLWVCAGALHTPRLLDRSLGCKVSRATVSDHVLCYLGQMSCVGADHPLFPSVERTKRGLWLRAQYNDLGNALYTMKPARFSFARLDHGIELRSAFGLPTSGTLKKIARSASLGLMAEALYNKFGLFPRAKIQSIYAQAAVPDAVMVTPEGEVKPQPHVVETALKEIRAHALWHGMVPSGKPDIFMPMIHLHHSVEPAALARLGMNTSDSAVQVVDGSIYQDIGPDHHSFKIMVGAFVRARATG